MSSNLFLRVTNPGARLLPVILTITDRKAQAPRLSLRNSSVSTLERSALTPAPAPRGDAPADPVRIVGVTCFVRAIGSAAAGSIITGGRGAVDVRGLRTGSAHADLAGLAIAVHFTCNIRECRLTRYSQHAEHEQNERHRRKTIRQDVK